mmetsp:Transcript_26305/g.25140  ORF Transcript_26305/g.25140 Transcript_26305/m.25140 type:complete len:287 (+) Transcript_26305:259-1119(+)|eukprot:CAMPEP_0119040436 /NCGR_PEP_ID=MMETSP1177-20130426/10353_1 /TAXON_ID=2985 /ORGANISM="Ochromonas sp, Strain CCMP1899" /LENGTH=286 /DNA_ID=CAMNT_0007005471 /DNA_START=250 /DNA_END=1110 /DNA_ORIENTATION=-
MGLCISSSSANRDQTNLESEDSPHRRDLHVDGMHAGDTPHPSNPRRPSLQPTSASNILNHSSRMRVNTNIENLDKLETTDPEIYDQCPTPFPRIESTDVYMSDITLSITKIVIISATVDGMDVKNQIEKLTNDRDSVHIKGGVCTVLGINPDKETEVFRITYMHTSDNQLQKKFNKGENVVLCAPGGFELRIIYVSYHGHDYAAIANSQLKNDNTLLDIPGGQVEELFKCPPSKSKSPLSISFDSPFLFTYIYQSPIINKSCGSTEDFIIDPYVALDTPTTIVDEI